MPHDRPRDRSSATRHLTPREAWRAYLDTGIPGCADHAEAARSAHGFGQGQRGVLGGESTAGQGVVRNRRHERGNRARGIPLGLRQAVRVDGVRQASGADMKAKDLRSKAPKDLGEELLKLRREQFNLRMARATGQAAKPDQFAKVRKNIARVKTVLAQSKASGGKA